MISKYIILLTSCILTTTINAEVLKVYADNWEPYNYVDNNQIVGISTELVEATLSRANIPYELVMMPWKRAYREVEFKKNALLFTVNRTESREKLFKWVGPILESEVYLYRLNNRDDIKINDISDVRGYSIGVLRGGAVQTFLDSHGFSDADYQIASKADLLLKLIFANRVDLIPGDRIDLAHQLKQTNKKLGDLEKAFFLYSGSYYIAVNIETPDEIVDKLQNALDELIQEGARERVVNKYMDLDTK